jgi:hypothetical protein
MFLETEIYNIMVSNGGIIGPVNAVLGSEVLRSERIIHLTTLLSRTGVCLRLPGSDLVYFSFLALGLMQIK